MAQSAHAYVRGNTRNFYEWLEDGARGKLPVGPPVWICGDCHVGNLGPIALTQKVEFKYKYAISIKRSLATPLMI